MNDAAATFQQRFVCLSYLIRCIKGKGKKQRNIPRRFQPDLIRQHKALFSDISLRVVHITLLFFGQPGIPVARISIRVM
ncbi:hypothetical protein D3C81_2124520 [compost metagenome]